MPKIKLQRGLYEGKDLGYSQLFGEHPEWYAKFNMKGHNGIDVPLPTGTKLISCINGVVVENAYDAYGYGKYIKLENDTCGVIYAHMKSQSPFKVGDAVKAGEIIGESGNTGNSTGPHLHFGVFPKPRNRDNGYAGYIDPFDKALVEWVDAIDGAVVGNNVENLRKLLEEMTVAKDEWKAKARKFETDIKDLKKTIEEKDEAYEKCKFICSQLEDKRNDLAIEVATLKEEKKVLEEKVSKAVTEVESALKSIVELRSQITLLQQQIVGGEIALSNIYWNIKSYLINKWEKFLNEIKKYIKY